MKENKKVFIEVSMKDIKEIEKIPGFMPIYLYPKISECHKRSWGFIINEDIEYFFRIDLNEEKIQKMLEQTNEISLRFSGLCRYLELGTVSYNDVIDISQKCMQACDILKNIYKD